MNPTRQTRARFVRVRRARRATGAPRGEAGGAIVELALCLPVMAVILGGIVDYALIIQQAMQVTQAAAAGAAYGATYGNQADLAGMQTAAVNAAAGITGLATSAATVYACTAGGTQVTSSALCSGYGTPIKYVQVQTSVTVKPLLGFGGLPSSVTLTGSSYYRVRWTP